MTIPKDVITAIRTEVYMTALLLPPETVQSALVMQRFSKKENSSTFSSHFLYTPRGNMHEKANMTTQAIDVPNDVSCFWCVEYVKI